jgi:hypothetical protein
MPNSSSDVMAWLSSRYLATSLMANEGPCMILEMRCVGLS